MDICYHQLDDVMILDAHNAQLIKNECDKLHSKSTKLLNTLCKRICFRNVY